MANLYWLDQIHADQLTSVGLKAFHLSQLIQLGCPVVPGFVIGSQVLQTVLENIQWTSPLFADFPGSSLRLNPNNARQLQAIAQQLRQAIATAPLLETLLQELDDAARELQTSALILRPSLLVESRLPAPPPTDLAFNSSGLIASQVSASDLDSFAQTLKQIWGDFFGAKSLFYWQRFNIPFHQLKLAVLVQPIQSAIASGTIRSVDHHLELSATVGLGTAITRGEVVPDLYQIRSDTGAILSQHIGQKSIAYQISALPSHASLLEDGNPLRLYLLDDQQRLNYALTEAQVQQLVQLLQTVREGTGTSVEMEWVMMLDHMGTIKPYITQVVPQSPLPRLVAHPAQPTVVQPRKGIELFPDATLIATGMAASPGQAIAPANVLADTTIALDKIPPHTVLIVPNLPLEWIPVAQQAAGLISEQGSLTSHSAIVAREMGIPAVMGVEAATHHIQSGELIWVDGDRGRIYRLAKSFKVPEALVLQPATLAPQPVPSVPPSSRTKLWVNLSQTEHLDRVADLPVDGVGLLRAELLAMTVLDHQHPALWLQHHQEQEFVARMAAAIVKFAAAFAPRPVLYRSLDLRSHEFSNPGQPLVSKKPHAMLGVRGTFSYQVDATLFNLELLALLAVQQKGYSNIHLMLPFVRTVEEFQFCRQRVQRTGLTDLANFQLWIMAEVPSVLLLLPDYVEAGVQGISIGTNDLTQLLLGVDRDDAQLAMTFEERHPAVKRAIAQLIHQARSLEIPCSICGEAPVRYPELIADLLRWGIDSISVAPEAVETTVWEMIRAEQKMRLEAQRSQ